MLDTPQWLVVNFGIKDKSTVFTAESKVKRDYAACTVTDMYLLLYDYAVVSTRISSRLALLQENCPTSNKGRALARRDFENVSLRSCGCIWGLCLAFGAP